MAIPSFILRALRRQAQADPILRRVLLAVKILIGRNPSGRLATIYPDDVVIVSYPKSGNTWTRFLVGNLYYRDQPVTFANVNELVPDLYANDRLLRQAPRPRLIKSHDPFDPRYRQVIYIVRDPRDVVVSYYHHHLKYGYLTADDSIETYFRRFVAGELDDYGPWNEHVGGWLGARRESKDFVLVRYEDLLTQARTELVRMASVLGVAADEDHLERVLELSSFDRMRASEVEQRAAGRARGLRQAAESLFAVGQDRPEKFFVRTGRAGGWKDELPQHLASQLESRWGDQMAMVGYL